MIAATLCMIAKGMAPASAPAKAVNGTRAVAQRPLDMQSKVNRLTRGFGTFGGCRVIKRRTDAAPTEDVAESLLRFVATGTARNGVFGFFQSHSFLYIVLTGSWKKRSRSVIRR